MESYGISARGCFYDTFFAHALTHNGFTDGAFVGDSARAEIRFGRTDYLDLVILADGKVGVFDSRADAGNVLSRTDGNDFGNFEFGFKLTDFAFDERLLVSGGIVFGVF